MQLNKNKVFNKQFKERSSISYHVSQKLNDDEDKKNDETLADSDNKVGSSSDEEFNLVEYLKDKEDDYAENSDTNRERISQFSSIRLDIAQSQFGTTRHKTL